MTSPISILLDCEQSEILTDIGECFAIVHKAMRTEQSDINGRMLLSLIPCSLTQANSALGTITGSHRATKIRTPKS